jgi:TP901 family phage tail tape measure protein
MAGIKKRIDIFLNGQQAGATIGNLYKRSRQLKNEINGLNRGSAEYIAKTNQLARVNTALAKHRQRIRGIKQGYKGLTAGISGALKAFGPLAAGTAIVGGIVTGVRQWVDVNLKLEKSMSSLKSLTGASNADMKVYREQAIAIGSETTLSATQAVDAFKLVGSARPELLKNRDALIEVTKEGVTLAEAAEMEMGPATQAMIGIMNQFGLANEDAARTSNVLAAGSKAGAAGIQELAESTDKSGTVAAGYNVSLEGNVGLLETLAEKNIKGAEAGTKLRNVLLTMQTIKALPPEALDQLKQYGVDTELVADKTVPFQERLEEIAKISGDATAMTKVFGKENEVAASILLNGTETVEKYTKAVTGTNTAQEQAAINTNNLDGDLKGLSSVWEGFMLKMDGGNSVLRKSVQWITELVKLMGGSGDWKKVMPGWIAGWANAFDSVDNFNNALMDTIDVLVGFVPGMKQLTARTRLYTDATRNLTNEQKYQNEVNRQALNEGKKIIDQRREEIGDISVLIDALVDENIEDSKKLEIRQKLQNDYPEYLENIDLETASTQQLIEVKKGLIAQILREGIEKRKAEAMATLTNNIIDLELKKIGASEKAVAVLDQQIKDFAAGIPLIEDVAEKVYESFNNTVSGMDFSKPFRDNNEALEETKSKIKGLEDELEAALAAGDEQRVDRAKKAIQAEEERMANFANVQTQMLDNALDAERDLTVNTTDQIKHVSKEAKKAAEALEKELEKIIAKTDQLKQEAANQTKIEGAENEEEQEIVKLEIALAEKFDAEIAAAKRIADKKGEIGERAAEQLKTLETLKTTELEKGKEVIREKYRKQRFEAAEKNNAHLVELELQAQQTAHELKVSRAAMAMNQINSFNLAERAKAFEEYKQAKLDQAEWEKQQSLDLLIEKFVNEEISEADFKQKKEDLEREHQGRLNKIAIDAAKERREEILNDTNQLAEAAKKGIAIIGKFREAEYNNELALITETKDEAIKALDEEKRKGLITEKEYSEKKAEIERKAKQDQANLEEKNAKAKKNAAIAEAIINGALAATKVIATFGPPPSPPAIAGLIVAGAQTAANVALIRSQEVPQFYEGGMHDVKGAKDGKNYRARYLGRHSGGMLPNSPSLVLTSEHGSEYFVPNHLLNHPQVANYVKIIEAIRTNQMATGGFTGSAATANETVSISSPEMASLIAQNTAVLVKLNRKLNSLEAKLPASEVERITELQNSQAQIRG